MIYLVNYAVTRDYFSEMYFESLEHLIINYWEDRRKESGWRGEGKEGMAPRASLPVGPAWEGGPASRAAPIKGVGSFSRASVSRLHYTPEMKLVSGATREEYQWEGHSSAAFCVAHSQHVR